MFREVQQLTIPDNTSNTKNGCNLAIQPCCSPPCKSHTPLLFLCQLQRVSLFPTHPFFWIWGYMPLSASDPPNLWCLYEIATKKEISPLLTERQTHKHFFYASMKLQQRRKYHRCWQKAKLISTFFLGGVGERDRDKERWTSFLKREVTVVLIYLWMKIEYFHLLWISLTIEFSNACFPFIHRHSGLAICIGLHQSITLPHPTRK